MNPDLGLVAAAAVVAWTVMSLFRLVADIVFRIRVADRWAEDADRYRADMNGYLARASGLLVQLGDIHAEAVVRVEALRHLADDADAAKHGVDTRTAAIATVPRPNGPPPAPQAY